MIAQKRSDNQYCAENKLKSRYLDKEKQKTVPLGNRPTKKILLTDLCTEEKLKVGELIKTLQRRRLQNEQLIEEIDKLRQIFEETKFQLAQATRQLQQKEQQCQSFHLRIAELQTKEKDYKVRNIKLIRDISKYKEIASLVTSVEKNHGWTQTDQQNRSSTCQQATQTKKTKTKRKSIQVSEKDEDTIERSIFYRPHSKSFQKIMKAPLQQQFNSFIFSQNGTNHRASHMQNQAQEIFKSIGKRQTDEELEINEDYLSKKWKKLQARNRIPDSSVSRSTNKFYDEFSQPREFVEIDDTQEDVSKKDSRLNSIDQLQLNKILKSKNFSANKLTSYRGVLSETQTFRKQIPSVQIEQKCIKIPIFLSKPSATKPKESSNILNPKDNGSAIISDNSLGKRISFYESDLLQIGNSIQS